VIDGGGPGGAGSAVFPDPPQGSPGAIAAAARTLQSAADDLERADGGLQNAGSALAIDWQGYAADAYHASSQALATVARAGAESFRTSAEAVRGYGAELDHTQSEIRRLRVLWEDAKHRQAAAGALAGRLGTALASATKPADITHLETQVDTAQGQADDAGTEADGYAGRATTALQQFRQNAARYQQALEGERPGSPDIPFGSPFSGTGSPGPGFGAPFASPGPIGPGGLVPGGLDPYAGVLPVGPNPYQSPIPGYPAYWDNLHQSLTSPDDLTLAIAMLGGPLGGAARDLGESGLLAILRAAGVGTGGDAAIAEAERLAAASARGERAALKALIDGGGGDGRTLAERAPGSAKAARAAGAGTAGAQAETRHELLKAAVDAISHQVSLPPGTTDLLKAAIDHGAVYGRWSVSRLSAEVASLNARGTPAALAAAKVIAGILRSVGG
jgi:uncharacterized protein YukE